ncbi:MAG: hypothetical protein KDD62_05495, partial [Bdellovibrionales bacterium]|nr:hypothetical protein [Bdellovibrionales bacterium]
MRSVLASSVFFIAIFWSGLAFAENRYPVAGSLEELFLCDKSDPDSVCIALKSKSIAGKIVYRARQASRTIRGRIRTDSNGTIDTKLPKGRYR